MKISIAMCTYNGARFLSEQLTSIMAQSRPPDEMIICDDGSTDETLPLLRQFAENAAFSVRIIENQIRLGSTANFSKAVDLSTKDIVVLSDQDDIWKCDKLEIIENTFSNDPKLACLFTNAELIDQSGTLLPETLWQKLKFSKKRKARFRNGGSFDLLSKGNFITGATMAFRSSWKPLLLPVPEGWVHDYWITLLLSAASKLDFIDQSLIQYRCHPQQQLGLRGSGKQGLHRLWVQFHTLQSADYVKAAQQKTELRDRLLVVGREEYATAIDECNIQIHHLMLRSRLPKNHLKRIPIMLPEVFNRNYFRYSSGAKSIIRDLLSNA
jgi:glycosyltransferase involved in cell wall biosynthesis